MGEHHKNQRSLRDCGFSSFCDVTFWCLIKKYGSGPTSRKSREARLMSFLFVWVTSQFWVRFCTLMLASHLFFFPFIFISWRLITLQYCSGFCHTLTWISHGFTCVPHPEPPSRLPPHPILLGLPRAPAPSTCLMHPTWAGDLFHPWYTCFNAVLSEHPTLAFSHRV